jgi:hypothetical protein
LTCFVVSVAYACLEVCLSSIDEALCSHIRGELASLVESGTRFDLPWFQGGVWSFVIEKPCVLVAALLSSELGICHPYGLV